VLSRFTNTPDRSPAVTINKFGKGNAIYLATESKASAIGPVLNSISRMVGLRPGPRTPDGVYARVVDGRTLYVNTAGCRDTYDTVQYVAYLPHNWFRGFSVTPPLNPRRGTSVARSHPA
jgi:hypothetical protein